jgi:hypothetical protein
MANPIKRKPDTAFRLISGAELDTFNHKHSNPEWLPAGPGRWVVVANEDGLKRLVDRDHFTSNDYRNVKALINASEPFNTCYSYFDSGPHGGLNRCVVLNDGDSSQRALPPYITASGPFQTRTEYYQVGNSGERNRYVVLFEGDSPQVAKAAYAMSGQLSSYLNPVGESAGTTMALTAGLDLTRPAAVPDRNVKRAGGGTSAQQTVKCVNYRFGRDLYPVVPTGYPVQPEGLWYAGSGPEALAYYLQQWSKDCAMERTGGKWYSTQSFESASHDDAARTDFLLPDDATGMNLPAIDSALPSGPATTPVANGTQRPGSRRL